MKKLIFGIFAITVVGATAEEYNNNLAHDRWNGSIGRLDKVITDKETANAIISGAGDITTKIKLTEAYKDGNLTKEEISGAGMKDWHFYEAYLGSAKTTKEYESRKDELYSSVGTDQIWGDDTFISNRDLKAYGKVIGTETDDKIVLANTKQDKVIAENNEKLSSGIQESYETNVNSIASNKDAITANVNNISTNAGHIEEIGAATEAINTNVSSNTANHASLVQQLKDAKWEELNGEGVDGSFGNLSGDIVNNANNIAMNTSNISTNAGHIGAIGSATEKIHNNVTSNSEKLDKVISGMKEIGSIISPATNLPTPNDSLDNATGLDTNTQNEIDKTNDKVDANKDQITANKDAIDEVKGTADTNADSIEKIGEFLTGKVKQQQDNAAGIEKNAAAIEDNRNAIMNNSSRIDSLQKESRNGIAGVAAMASMDFKSLSAGEVGIGVGYGNFKDSNAVAVGVGYAVTDNFSTNVKLSTAGEDWVTGAGAVYKFSVK